MGSVVSSLGREQEEEEAGEHRRKLLILLAFELMNDRAKGRKCQFRDFLSLDGMWRRDRRIPREALLDPQSSPWQKLYSSKNDQALITATGFDYAAFATMHSLFEPYFHAYTPWTGDCDGSTMIRVKVRDPKKRRGRPRKVDSKSALGLTLAWHRFRGPEFILQGWFGLTGTPANVWLKFGRRVLLFLLWKNDLAKVRMPPEEHMQEFQAIIKARHSALDNVFCFADRLKLHFENTESLDDAQNMCYNGWQQGHFVTNLFVFTPDGRLCQGVGNAPGTVHDSSLAEWGDAYGHLHVVYNCTGAKCCVDSAFAAGNAPYLLKSAQDKHSVKLADEVVALRQATSLRQAAKWGMHAIQGSFPRLFVMKMMPKREMSFSCWCACSTI